MKEECVQRMKLIFGIGSFHLVPPSLANIGTEKKDYDRGKEVDIIAVLAYGRRV
jgi:hypothetical protein